MDNNNYNNNDNNNYNNNNNGNNNYNNNNNNNNSTNFVVDNNLARFLLTFFLGFIGSIIINHSSLKPRGFKSRTLAYFFLSIVTFGIYGLVASICNLTFDPNKPSNIGYFKD